MQTEPQITFDDLPVDPGVQAAALDHVARLEAACDRITGCHVVIAQPHRRHREGRLFSVRVDLVVPGAELVVNRNHPLDHAHEDVYVALRDSFDAVRRRLEDHVRQRRGDVKRHAPRAEGTVTRIFPLQGYGFIETPDGREIYFHRHALSADEFRVVDLGSRVHFTEEDGESGPQAAHVELVDRLASRRERP